MIRLIVSCLAALVISNAGAIGQDDPPVIISEQPAETAITIYPDDLSMITETRRVDLPAGKSKIEIQGVNDQMIPQSALLTEFGAMSIERNFDFDILTEQALFENAVGKTVTLYRENRATGLFSAEEAIVISGGQGVVLKIGDRIESYDCSGIEEAIGFDRVPDGLKSKPTLSLVVDAKEAGPQEFTFRYLARGFSWEADYILSVDGKKRGDLFGWLTATNSTSIGLYDVDLSIVAGELNLEDDTEAPEVEPLEFVANCHPPAPPKPVVNGYYDDRLLERVVVTGSRLRRTENTAFAAVIAEREDLGDYKLYRAPFATDVAAKQTKQVAFLDKNKVKVSQVYSFDYSDYEVRYGLFESDGEILHAIRRYSVDNSRDGKLAEALPAGTVRVLAKQKDGDRFFLGSGSVRNLAIGRPMIVDSNFSGEIGLLASRNNERDFQVGRYGEIRAFDADYEFLNTSDRAVTIELKIALDPDEKIAKSSIRPTSEGPIMVWRFRVKANSSRRLTFEYGPK